MAKKSSKKMDLMGMIDCCGSFSGIIHFVAGVGVAFLIVSYVAVPNMVMLGWALVGLGVLGHIFGWNKCKKCGL